MTVLIAADSAAGETAYDALVDAGFEVERVETLAAARVRAATAAAVVVGSLADGDPVDLRADLVEDGSPRIPLVRLGRDAAFETCVDLPVDAAELADAVRLALRTSEYRDAVDDLFERCRELAEGDGDATGESPTPRDLEAAKQRAQTRLREARRAAGRTPYEQLFSEFASDDAGGDEYGDGDDDAGDAG